LKQDVAQDNTANMFYVYAFLVSGEVYIEAAQSHRGVS